MPTLPPANRTGAALLAAGVAVLVLVGVAPVRAREAGPPAGPPAVEEEEEEPAVEEVRALLEAGDEVARPVLGALGRRAAKALVALLEDGTAAIRARAARALGRIGPGAVPVAALRARLGDEAPSARWAAIEALGALGDASVAPDLARVLADTDLDFETRGAAARALGVIGSPGALAALVERVGAERAAPAFRREVALAVLDLAARAGTEVGLRAALEEAARADAPAVRVVALGGLALLAGSGEAGAVRALVAALGDDDEDARDLAEACLAQVGAGAGDEVARRLRDLDAGGRRAALRLLAQVRARAAVDAATSALADPAVGDEAARVLGRLGDARAIEPLAAALEPAALERDLTLRRRAQAAADALARFGPAALPALARAAGRPDPRTRLFAAVALGRTGAPGAAAPLASLLDDRDSRVRQAAAVGLGRIGGEPVLEPLARASADLDRDVRIAGIRGLGGLGLEGGARPLLDARSDPDAEVRLEALRALARVPGTAAARALAEALATSASVPERAAAVEAIGASADAEAPGRLVAALGDTSSIIRVAAAEALARRGDPETEGPLLALALAEDDPAVRALVAATLSGKRLARVLPDLEGALAGTSTPAKRRAAEVLGLAGGAEADRLLALAAADADASVRREVARARTRIRLRAVRVEVRRLASSDPAVRRAAARALGDLGERAALEALREALPDPDPTVVEAILGAIARLSGAAGGRRP